MKGKPVVPAKGKGGKVLPMKPPPVGAKRGPIANLGKWAHQPKAGR